MGYSNMASCKALYVLIFYPNAMRDIGGVLKKSAFFKIKCRSHSMALFAFFVLKLCF